MPDMVNMKEKHEGGSLMSSADDRDYYPCLYLSGDQVAQLGLDRMKVGEDLAVMANARLTSLSKNETKEGVTYSAHLEIVEMAVAPKKTAAEKMFGEK